MHYREVSPGYFTALGARLVRGRGISEQDDASHPPVVVVNEALVRKYFPGEEPVGRQIQYASTSTQPPMEIVGVIADIKESAIDSETPPTIYVAFAQDPDQLFRARGEDLAAARRAAAGTDGGYSRGRSGADASRSRGR